MKHPIYIYIHIYIYICVCVCVCMLNDCLCGFAEFNDKFVYLWEAVYS